MSTAQKRKHLAALGITFGRDNRITWMRCSDPTGRSRHVTITHTPKSSLSTAVAFVWGDPKIQDRLRQLPPL